MNFILRRITSENRQSNEMLGKSYHFIYDDRRILPKGGFDPNQETSMSESFQQLLKGYPKDTHEQIHAFILSDIGNKEKLEHRKIPIYGKSKYFIMTDSGGTFDRIKAFVGYNK
jgi:hypothetical protein